MNFIHKVSLDLSKCLSKWIKVEKWDYFRIGPQDFFLFYILIFIYFFKYETIVRSSASSFGHSDPDPGSVLFNPWRPSFLIITRLHDFLNWCNLYCDPNPIPIHKVLPASLHQPVTKYQMRIDQFGHLLFKRNVIWKEKGQPKIWIS